MNCRKVNSLLSAYIDSELTGFEQLQIRQHLNACDECTAEYDALLGMKRMVARLRVQAPVPQMLERVLQQVHYQETESRFAMPQRRLLPTTLIFSRAVPTGIALGACAAVAVAFWFGSAVNSPSTAIQWSPVVARDVTPLGAAPIQDITALPADRMRGMMASTVADFSGPTRGQYAPVFPPPTPYWWPHRLVPFGSQR